MEQSSIFGSLVPEDILTTNRLPTNEEKQLIQQSVAPFNVKLQNLGTQISSLWLQIQEAKAQVVQMEGELKRLCNEEAAVMKACAPHRLALSPFRTLPDDVLREICTACVDDKEYTITTSELSPIPLTLAQISSRMRYIALTTPILWASVQIIFWKYTFYGSVSFACFRTCARGVNEWFQRAGGLALKISVIETTSYNTHFGPDVSELFDVLFSYSARWREVTFNFASLSGEPLARIAALKAADVPLLRSLSLAFRTDSSSFHHGTVLSIPTLKHLYLDTWKQDVAKFSANYANLTVLHIHGRPWGTQNAVSSIASILRQTTRLVNCSINVGSVTEIGYAGAIFLPCLQSLSVAEILPRDTPNPQVPGLLRFIHAPVLQALNLSGVFSTSSLSLLFRRSPILQHLVLNLDAHNFTDLKELLYYCPSLLSLVITRPRECDPYNMPRHLHTSSDALFRAFVCDSERGYLCPRLHTFIFDWEVHATVDCIRQLIIGKRNGHGIAGLHSWNKVVLTLRDGTDSWPQISELMVEQRAAGMNVSLLKPDYRRR